MAKQRGAQWQRVTSADADRMGFTGNKKLLELKKRYEAEYEKANVTRQQLVELLNSTCHTAAFNVMNGAILWVPANKIEVALDEKW